MVTKEIAEKLEGIKYCKKSVKDKVYDHMELAIKYGELHELYVLQNQAKEALNTLKKEAEEYKKHETEWETHGDKLPSVSKDLIQDAKRMEALLNKSQRQALVFAANRLLEYHLLNAEDANGNLSHERHKEKVELFQKYITNKLN